MGYTSEGFGLGLDIGKTQAGVDISSRILKLFFFTEFSSVVGFWVFVHVYFNPPVWNFYEVNGVLFKPNVVIILIISFLRSSDFSLFCR